MALIAAELGAVLWQREPILSAVLAPGRAGADGRLMSTAALAVIGGLVAVLAHHLRRREGAVRRAADLRIAALETRIEDQARVIAELQHAREVAETANEAKSRYMVAVSHEIRSPLNAIYGYAQLLERDDTMSRSEAGAVIRNSAEHLTNLVEGLLEISRIESGVLKVRADIIELPPLIEGVIGMFRMQAAAKGLRLDLVLRDRLPLYVRTDEKRLRQILINLLSNAIKYTQEGGVTIMFGFRSQVADIEIVDTGVGIAEEDMERIFQPFERGRSPESRLQPGIGLGLTITRVLAHILGGDLAATSTPGLGSSFRLRLMLPEPLHSELESVLPSHHIVGYEGPPRSVLIVDDDAAQREAMRRLLSAIGFTVCLAGDADQGMTMADRHPVDIALLDIQLPGLSGWDLAARLRAGHRAMRIVMVSANVHELGAGSDQRSSHDGFMTKPVAYDGLLTMIGTQLGLAWRRTAEAPSSPAVAEPSATLPPEAKSFVATLRQLAKVGHIGGIEVTLAELEEAVPAASPLVAALRIHTDQFDLKSFVKVLDHAER